ncbi:MAG: serine/threonine protein kinase [Polyangiaceae bacterium]|nr:serine/threonine protein kinase [Myxococcales bacterium]MCB9587000.1 serine/threonine protein kinase [Polyangiaceae bacterium]
MDHLRPGMRLDRYELVAPLAAGGQGSVWRVRDPLDPSAPRAVKLVDLVQANPDGIERVRREAHQLAQLRHPSIVPCHGLFEDVNEGMLGLVVTYIDGMPVGGLLNDPRFDARRRRLLLTHLAEALAFIHARKIVHRDLKLDNVLADDRFLAEPEVAEHVKLIDFGIALAPTGGRKLTQAGHIVGTPSYMAPETLDAAWGGSMNAPAVDVFAFGVMAWRMFLPGHPSGVQNARNLADYAIAYRRMKSEPGRFSALDARPDLRWLRQCLSLEPEKRLPDGAALVEALRSSQMPASQEELAATQVAAPGYTPAPLSGGSSSAVSSAQAPSALPTAYSPGQLPRGNISQPASNSASFSQPSVSGEHSAETSTAFASSTPGQALASPAQLAMPTPGGPSPSGGYGPPPPARSNRFAIGLALGLGAAVIFAIVAVVGVSGAALFAFGDRQAASAGPPAAICASGSALPASREVTLWIGPVELADNGSKRNLKSDEGLCLTNLRTGQRRCARGNQWSPTIQARIGDLLTGGAGVQVQFERNGAVETLANRADLGFSTITCPQSGWLMPLAPNTRLQTLPIFPR